MIVNLRVWVLLPMTSRPRPEVPVRVPSPAGVRSVRAQPGDIRVRVPAGATARPAPDLDALLAANGFQ